MPLFRSTNASHCSQRSARAASTWAQDTACTEEHALSSYLSWLAYGNDQKHAQADATFIQARSASFGRSLVMPHRRSARRGLRSALPQRREFCFTLEGDIFVRYQSFKDATELHSALKDRRARPPPP